MDAQLLAKLLSNSGKYAKKPDQLSDFEIQDFVNSYKTAYGTDSSKARPMVMNLLGMLGGGGKVLLGTNHASSTLPGGGETFTRASDSSLDMMTPELPEIAQRLAMVLAERNRRIGKVPRPTPSDLSSVTRNQIRGIASMVGR